MITRFIKHSKPTNVDEEQDRPAKCQKLDDATRKPPTLCETIKHEATDNDDTEDGSQNIDKEEYSHVTDLESALPPIETSEEAIEEYEAFKASQEDKSEGAEERLNKRTWVRGKSSLYVDAFNLALDTVLDEESHLFDEAETEVFRVWRELNYEAQFL